jgi:outer membrane receptor protein involved in Fe transport
MKNHFIIVIVLFLCHNLSAGTTGKLAGKIRDQDGKEIPYVNLSIENLGLGIQSDENGNYLLFNVPPGIYEINSSRVSFRTHVVRNVEVISDETTILNITLSKSAQEIEGIQISESTNKVVDRLKVSSGNPISSEDIKLLPIQKIDDLIALQAGTVIVDGELHIRGGKVNEVVYMIDGLPVTNAIDGSPALTLDVDAIKEIKVMTGGFPAEYGNAQSAVINMITKDGGKNYHGKFETISDHLLSRQNQNSDQVKFAFSGPVFPILKDKLTFFVNYNLHKHDSEFIKEYTANAGEELLYLDPIWTGYDYYNPYYDRSEFTGFDVGDRLYNLNNGSLKLIYKITPTQKFVFGMRVEDDTWQPFDHEWRYALENYRKIDIERDQYVFSYENVLKPNMVLNFSASYFKYDYNEQPRNISDDTFFIKDEENFELYAANNPGNSTGIIYNKRGGFVDYLLAAGYWRYFIPELMLNIPIEEFKAPSSVSPDFIDNKNNNITFDLDFEWQLNPIHDLKTGIDFTQHNLDQYRYSSPWEVNTYRYRKYLNNHATPQDSLWVPGTGVYHCYYTLDDIYAATLAASGDTFGFRAKPWQGSWYLQDKMDWEGLVVHAGIRLDVWNLGKKYEILNDLNQYEEASLEADNSLNYVISPRLRISHTISQTDILHFAYNKQVQLPQLQYVYPAASWYDPDSGFAEYLVYLFANPNLKPPTTNTWEVGLQHQFNDDYVGDVTVFYKQNYYYVSIEKEVVPGSVALEYNRFTSDNYGKSSGVDVNLQKRLSNFTSGSLSYTLSWSKGSDAMIYDHLQQDQDLLMESSNAWDARHTMSLNLSLNVKDDEYMKIPFTDTRVPIDDFNINLLYNLVSGTPITDIEDEAHEYSKYRLPFSDIAQLTITKGFNIGRTYRFRIYCHIENLFDKRNIDFAYLQTGSPYNDGSTSYIPGNNFAYEEAQHIHAAYANNPENLAFGRRILLGVSYSF